MGKVRKVWRRNPRTQVVQSRKRYDRRKIKRETQRMRDEMNERLKE